MSRCMCLSVLYLFLLPSVYYQLRTYVNTFACAGLRSIGFPDQASSQGQTQPRNLDDRPLWAFGFKLSPITLEKLGGVKH